MSRSIRHTQIFPFSCAETEKPEKVKSHKRLRGKIKKVMSHDPEAPIPIIQEVYDPVWMGPKDGKHWWGKASKKNMRK